MDSFYRGETEAQSGPRIQPGVGQAGAFRSVWLFGRKEAFLHFGEVAPGGDPIHLGLSKLPPPCADVSAPPTGGGVGRQLGLGV